MGLFDFLKPKENQTANILREKYEQAKSKNDAWQKDFDAIINFRNKAAALEKKGKLYEAIEEYSNQLIMVSKAYY